MRHPRRHGNAALRQIRLDRNTEWIASITARSGASGVVRILAL